MFTVKDLVFKYPKNAEDTIKGIDFEIKQGEIFGFLGPSGAGKTTTQKLLVKLLAYDKGEIHFDEKTYIHSMMLFMKILGYVLRCRFHSRS